MKKNKRVATREREFVNANSSRIGALGAQEQEREQERVVGNRFVTTVRTKIA